MQRRHVAALLGTAAVLAGCGGGEQPVPAAPVQRDRAESSTRPGSAPSPPPPRCAAAAPNCAEAEGRIVFVERVDPDGDGDAHFVLLDWPGLSGPGISVIDVAAGLRPRPLPGPGDLLAAAGPVFEGSFGQRQIQATAVTTARAPR